MSEREKLEHRIRESLSRHYVPDVSGVAVPDIMQLIDVYSLIRADAVTREVKIEVHKAAIRYQLEHERGLKRAQEPLKRWHMTQIDELLKEVEEANKRKEAR